MNYLKIHQKEEELKELKKALSPRSHLRKHKKKFFEGKRKVKGSNFRVKGQKMNKKSKF